MSRSLGILFAFAVAFSPRAGLTQPAGDPLVPLVPGLTFVLAVHNAPPPGAKASTVVTNLAQGDYEMVVAVTAVSAAGVDETTRFEAFDENKKPLQVTVSRRVRTDDLADARQQLLGFHTEDPNEVPGTTSLGPSLAIVRDLQASGSAKYSAIPFLRLPTSSGVLTRVGTTPVRAPVLLNGRRVELPAIRVTGQLEYAKGKVRPWEQDIYDHPQHPVTLRLLYGADGTAIGSPPIFTREVVRIDFPTPNTRLEEALSTQCRFEVPGIYFDFNKATLDPRSTRALTEIAELLRKQPQWRVAIEGHTDNIGTDAYNQDLSTRRAGAVVSALVRDFSIAAARLKSAGFGESRPVETNDTLAGRARNRRVELVRDCAVK